MKFGIVVFPGSNCEYDCQHVIGRVFQQPADLIWHTQTDLGSYDCVVVPGGFSYGDYLRTGAIARFSPVMAEVRRHAARGGLVLGLCNGFQILTEAGLLPGALMSNKGLTYLCRFLYLRLENADTPFTRRGEPGQVLRMPIAHYDGCYYADDQTLDELEESGRVAFRYCDSEGKTGEEWNPNGSCNHIAGILNEGRNVLGMMPHPERCAEEALGAMDGRLIFESLLGNHG